MGIEPTIIVSPSRTWVINPDKILIFEYCFFDEFLMVSSAITELVINVKNIENVIVIMELCNFIGLST